MRKKITYLVLGIAILFATKNTFGQGIIHGVHFTKEVESKISENRKQKVDSYTGIHIIYTFTPIGVTTQEEATRFKNFLTTNYPNEIYSVTISEENGKFDTQIETNGNSIPDRIKEILLEHGFDIGDFHAEYILIQH